MISIIEKDRREQHSHAHRILRECLRPSGVDYGENTPVSKGRFGKPSLTGYPGIHYNLSHANGIAACIVSDCECGIDCENVREFRPNVMKRAFSENERRLVEEAPPDERSLMFFRLWTLKEAYVKATGTGITVPLNDVEFSFDGSEIISCFGNCRFRQYILNGGKFVVSVCELM